MWTWEKQKVLSLLQMIPVQIHSYTFLSWNDSPQNYDIATFPREHRGCRGSQEGQRSVGSTVGRKQVGEGTGSTGSQWLEDRGANGRKELLHRGQHRKHPFAHSWKEKRVKEQRDVKRQGLTTYCLCSCSEDNPQMTHGWLDAAWKATITWWTHCTKTVLPSKGTSWLLIAKTCLKIGLKMKVCSFFLYISFMRTPVLTWLKLGAEQMSRQKKGFIWSILFSWAGKVHFGQF